MDKTPENNSASNQNELDFGSNQNNNDLVQKSKESSFLNKLFSKKDETATNPFAQRKEPTFGTAAVSATANSQTTANVASSTVNYSSNNFNKPISSAGAQLEERTVSVETAQPETVEKTATVNAQSSSQSEIPSFAATDTNNVNATNEPQSGARSENAENAATSAKPNMKNPENWAVMQKLPTKHRRLFIAIAGAVAVLVALLLLKPSKDTVEDFQAGNNGSNMPIEFQSLDPNQSVENADASNTVPPADQADVNQQTGAPAESPEANAAAINNGQPAEPPVAAQPTPPVPAQQSVPAQQPAPQPVPVPLQPNAVNSQEKPSQEKIAREQEKAEQARQAQLARAEKAKSEQKARAEKAKAEQQAQAAAEKAKAEQRAKQAAERARAQAALNGAPITEAKPVSKPQSAAAPAPKASGASKTLVVPASTSLFQVFRNNGLDIRDVNAMTKANGVGNALSNFKAGDKVQVATNSEGRVTSMRLADGSVFTRQADGTYKYSK